MPATAATAAGDNPLHAVLTEMLSDARGGSVKLAGVTPTQGNWRTRQVIRELKGIRSAEDLFLTEYQIRGVVTSQETRCRVKLLNAFLSYQYLAEEQASVREEEECCRQTLTRGALSVLRHESSLLSLVGREMCGRYSLLLAWRGERAEFRKCHKLEVLALKEQSLRRLLTQAEGISRMETERRRFLAVGREIDMELQLQMFCRITSAARSRLTKFTLDLALLTADEERERCSLEKLYLLKLSLLANDHENAAARLVVTSVMRASLMRRKLQDDAQRREQASRFLLLPAKELDIRGIIERKEMEERQTMRVSFLTTWRGAFKRTMYPNEGAAILDRLELYERRGVFDQWRFGFNALNERQERERRALVCRETACDIFFQFVADTLSALWREEGEHFNVLLKRYSEFVWSSRMLRATTVLDFEERAARQRIIEAEARESIKARSSLYLHHCIEAALRGAASITEMEAACRLSLMQGHVRAVAEADLQHLLHEEECLRLEVDFEASAAWSEIVLQESAPRGRDVGSLEGLEEAQRTLHVRQEHRRFTDHKLRSVMRVEASKRGLLREEEVEGRVGAYAFVLAQVEAWNRLELQAESQDNLLRILFRATEHREQLERAVLAQCERERREFIFGSFDYALPHLRACEVDELDGRLDIINEAELTMGALACRWGRSYRLAYCSEELRLSQCILRFMSLTELFQCREVELLGIAEPLSRREVVDREILERLLRSLEAHEERGRIRIKKAATDAYNATQDLFDRVLSRADEWRTRGVLREPVVLTAREELIDYFRRQETSVAVRLRAQQVKTREQLGSFFTDFYWGRDTIVVEEFVGREGIMEALRRPHLPLRAMGQESGSELVVRLHSIALMTSDALQPPFIKVYDSVDNVGVTCEMYEAQSLVAAGRIFRVCFPLRPMRWVRHLTNESNVLYFEVSDQEGNVVATASLFIRSEDLKRTPGATVASLPTDDKHGKMNVVLYVH
ncbi:uncharacterized protein Tco025E_05948 [Trypanosoma conorhini]|uniref:Uncharacterized protein n=1 Tax=Trypanosoma conorhini TaxID=83891 RepID=A0A3R7KVD3_9TRYP|nr:uncharacterized protein Tco025E_05948 [Trypanosoma conorhini]RNF14133.1 hypothetical protein Tco025E_05948 [Trypanosoma conorhini]